MARGIAISLADKRSELLSFLGKEGSASAREAAAALGVSQPAFSRIAKASQHDLLIVGRARAVRYAAYRDLPRLGRTVPIFDVDAERRSRKIAILHATRPNGFYVESLSADVQSGFFADLPYFLDDLRPSGFLGRLAPLQHPHLELPSDIGVWTSNNCLEYLARCGSNLPGNFIVGDEAFRLYLEGSLSPPGPIPSSSRPERFEEIANDVMAFGIPGSSAAGEQPKFITSVEGSGEVIVKFSPPLDGPIARRIADLLISEHLAHEALRAHGHASLESEIVAGTQRVFLQTRRFDRTLEGGRIGTISLAPLDAELVGSLGTWSQTATSLAAQGRISPDLATEVRWLELFGKLIANTDMHLGNLSFFVRGTQLLGLAPTYDMLPMLYVPQQSTIVPKKFSVSTPGPELASHWSSALTAAKAFWDAVSDDARISSGFRHLAAENRAQLEPLSGLERLLPARDRE
jgi:hypothetical protein